MLNCRANSHVYSLMLFFKVLSEARLIKVMLFSVMWNVPSEHSRLI